MSRLPLGLCGAVVIAVISTMAATAAEDASDANPMGERSVYDVYDRITSWPDLPRSHGKTRLLTIPLFSMSEDEDTERLPDAIVLTHIYGYEAACGDEHDCPATPDLHGPWGAPGARDGRGATLHPTPQPACAGGHAYDNDGWQAHPRMPRYSGPMRSLYERGGAWWGGEPRTPFMRELTAAHLAVTAKYEGEKEFLPSVRVPPYSRGELHWPITVTGEMITLVCFPYDGAPEDKRWVKDEIERWFNWENGVGAEEPGRTVCAKVDFTDEQKERWHVERAYPVGDMLGVTIEERGRPFISGLRGITAPVTINLAADKTAPDDAPGPIGGTATVTQVGPCISDEPPPGLEEPLKLVFPSTGENKGTCTVELPKGWRYELTLDDGGIYRPESFTLHAPCREPLNLSVNLARCRLVMKTQRDGIAVAAHVQVLDSEHEVIFEGDTSEDSNWELEHVFTGLSWRKNVYLRAKPAGASDERYADPETVQLKPSTIPKVVRVRVPPILPRPR